MSYREIITNFAVTIKTEHMDQNLIALAFKLRDARMWETLSDSDIYAVRLRSGETAYCCIMGNSGQHFGLGIYVGVAGWNTYLRFGEMDALDNKLELHQMMCTKLDCINCDFMPESLVEASEEKSAVIAYAKEHALLDRRGVGIPEFTRYAPYLAPGPVVDAEDLAVTEETLSASLYLARLIKKQYYVSLGFLPEGIHPSPIGGQIIPMLVPDGKKGYTLTHTTLPARSAEVLPAVPIDRPELTVQIAMLPVRSNTECRFIAIDTPVMPKGEKGYFPVTLLCVDGNTGMVSFTEIGKFDPALTPAKTVEDFAYKMIAAKVRPSVIYVEDSFTEALLKNLCSGTGIRLQRVSRLKHLREAWTSLSEGMKR